jgi:hypothetical protein
MAATDQEKINSLFKEANNVVNVVHQEPFTNPTNRYPFTDYVINDTIFSTSFPADLSNVSYTSGGITYYGCPAKHQEFTDNSVTDGSFVDLAGGTLRFYYNVTLQQALPGNGNDPKRTWYVPDPSSNSNSQFSGLSDMIPFNYDPSWNSYLPVLTKSNGFQEPYFTGNFAWLVDPKSGFVQIFGSDTALNTNIPNPATDQPKLSYIKYIGAKGAGGSGGDASFNSVEATDISCDNLLVRNQAILPEDTLIDQKELSNTGRTGYPLVTSFDWAYIKATEVNTGDWITIARAGRPSSTSNIRADAYFEVESWQSGVHQTMNFHASHKFGRGNAINMVHHDWYGGALSWRAIRIVYFTNNTSTTPDQGTYDGAILQLQINSTSSDWRGQIRVSHNTSYYGWEPYRDTVVDSFNDTVFQADNNPVCFITGSTNIGNPYDRALVLDELDWNPTLDFYLRANNISTVPFRAPYVKVLNDLLVEGNVDICGNVAVEGTLDVSLNASFEQDVVVDRNTITQGDSLIMAASTLTSQYRSTFDQTSGWIPLAWVAIETPFQSSSGVHTSIQAACTFRITASDPGIDQPQLAHVLRGRVIVSTGAISATTPNSDTSEAIYIDDSSCMDLTTTQGQPLIKRVFITKIASNIPLVSSPAQGVVHRYGLFVELNNPATGNKAEYLEAKFYENEENIKDFPPSGVTNVQYWRINDGFNVQDGSNLPTIVKEAVISSAYGQTFTHIGSENVSIPGHIRGNDISCNDISCGDITGVDASFSTLHVNGEEVAPGNYALKESVTFTLDTANFSDGDWLTIARAGDGTDRNALRAEGLFYLHERSGSHHSGVIARCGGKFSSGHYIDVESSSWFSSMRVTGLRIMFLGTYDGFVLQAQLKSSGGSGTFYLSLYQNRDNQGWDIVSQGTNLGPDNSPGVYVTDTPSSPTGTAYTSSREAAPLDHDPQGRNSMSTTTKDHVFQEGYVNINQGRLNLVETNATISDGYLNINGENSVAGIDMDGGPGAHPTFSMKEGGDVSFETSEAGAGFSVNTESSGTASTISLVTDGNILIRSDNIANTAGTFSMGGGNTFFFNGSGFDMNSKNVVGASTIECNNLTRHTSSSIRIGDLGSSTTSGRFINMLEPTLIFRATNANGTSHLNNLGGGTFPTAANGMQFFDNTNQFPVQRRGFSSLPTPLYTNWAQTSPYRFTCVIATSIRNGAPNVHKRLTSSTSYLEHATSDEFSLWEVSSTGQGSPVILTRHLMSYDCLIRAVTVQTYGVYCSIANTTGSMQVVDMELWVGYEDGTNTGSPSLNYHSFNPGSTWPSNMLSTDIKNGNTTTSNYARRLNTRSISVPTSGASIYNPFINGSNSYAPETFTLDSPLYVPKGKVATVYAVERRVNSISSGYVQFTTYAFGLGGSGFASAPMTCNVVGEMNFNS